MDIERVWLDYRDRLLRFIASRVGSDVDPEDVLQIVFEKVLRNASSLKSEESLTSWLFRITRNAIVDEYRKQGRVESGLDLSLEIDPRDGRNEMETLQELQACLLPFIKRLDEPYKQTITLVEIEGITQVELATRLGVTVSAVKSRVQRGREKLHSMLSDCCSIERNQNGEFVDWDAKYDDCTLAGE